MKLKFYLSWTKALSIFVDGLWICFCVLFVSINNRTLVGILWQAINSVRTCEFSSRVVVVESRNPDANRSE